MLIKEEKLRKIIRDEIKSSISEAGKFRPGIHSEKGAELVSFEKSGKEQEVIQAIDAVLSQFQAIHSGQASRDAASKARKSAKIIYDFVKGKENRLAQGIFPPSEVVTMAKGLATNPEETVEKYVRPLLDLKKKIK